MPDNLTAYVGARDQPWFAGRRGLLLDSDGVLQIDMVPVPGVPALLADLAAAGVPVRVITNATTHSRATLGARLRAAGLPVATGQIVSAAAATAAYVARRFPGERCYLLPQADAAADFVAAGVEVVGPDGEPPAGVVVIGGAEDELTYARLNHAYRLLLGGARLVAMHRNVAWRTAIGLQLDSGPFIEALARAAGVRFVTVGKPAAAFFRQAIRASDLPPAALIMVGDDLVADILPARRLGLAGVLVATGKPVPSDAATRADLVLPSLADLRPYLIAAALLPA